MAQFIRSFTVVPFVGASALRLGMHLDDVLALMGPPDARNQYQSSSTVLVHGKVRTEYSSVSNTLTAIQFGPGADVLIFGIKIMVERWRYTEVLSHDPNLHRAGVAGELLIMPTFGLSLVGFESGVSDDDALAVLDHAELSKLMEFASPVVL